MNLLETATGHPFFACAALAGTIALFGIVADVRHSRRTDRDKVSLVAWGTVSSAALMVAIVSLAMGLRAGG